MKVRQTRAGYELLDDEGKSLGIYSSAAQADQMKNLYAYQGQMQALGKTAPTLGANAQPTSQEPPWVLKRYPDGSTDERDDDGVVRRYYPPPQADFGSKEPPATSQNASAKNRDTGDVLPPLPATQGTQGTQAGPTAMPSPVPPVARPMPEPQRENSDLSPAEKRARNEEMQARLATVGPQSVATGDPNVVDEVPLPTKPGPRMSAMSGADWDLARTKRLADPYPERTRRMREGGG